MARTPIATPGFLDRLGDRVIVSDPAGGDLEVLRLRLDLTADPRFETSLASRAAELSTFDHRGVARVRGTSRLAAGDGRLAIVSDAPKGWRLSEVLQAAEHENRQIHTSAVLFVLRQVAATLTALHAAGPEVSHGALGPDRVVLIPGGRVLVVEYVLGSALAWLPVLPADRLWKDLRLAVPAEPGSDGFGPRTDVLQLGIIALSLVHNRLLRRDEYPGRLSELLDAATESRLTGARQPIGPGLRRWIERALALGPDSGHWTMEDAQHALDAIISSDGGYFSTPVGLEPLLQSVDRFFTVPPAPEAVAEPDLPAPPTENAPESRVLAWVRPATTEPVHAAPPGASGQPAAVPALAAEAPRAVEAEPSFDPPQEPLAASVPKPAPAPPPPARFPEQPWPTAPGGPPAVVDLAPVADMLSVDRPSLHHRSGWNSEPWLSRSTDRQPSGARSVAGSLLQTARSPKSGAVAVATAAARCPVEESIFVPECEPEPNERPGLELRLPAIVSPLVTPPAAASDPAPPGPSPAEPAATVAAPPRPLFDLSEQPGEPGAEEADDSLAKRRGRKTVWAAAAFALVSVGAVAGWAVFAKPDAPVAAHVAQAEVAGPAGEVAEPGSPGQAQPPVAAQADVRSGAPAPASSNAAAPASADPLPARGSVQIASALTVSVSENGRPLGTSGAPIVLTAGRHSIEVSNEETGFRAVREVDVRGGRVSRVELALPQGTVNFNASPWAEVFVDGQKAGETPLGNVQLAIGPHEVKFRHPQLGEKVRTVVVTTRGPARLSVDMQQ